MDEHIFAISIDSPWFADIANYLVSGKFPSIMNAREKINIIYDSAKYSWVANELYKTGRYFIIRICVREDEMPDILKGCHDEPCGGHFADKRTNYKVLNLG